METLAETAGKLSDAAKERHPATPWRVLVGFRNIAAHAHRDLVADRAWEIVARNPPPPSAADQAELGGCGDWAHDAPGGTEHQERHLAGRPWSDWPVRSAVRQRCVLTTRAASGCVGDAALTSPGDDRIDKTGRAFLRNLGRLRHLGPGRAQAGERLHLLVANRVVRILAEDGSLLRSLTLDPARDHQPVGNPTVRGACPPMP